MKHPWNWTHWVSLHRGGQMLCLQQSEEYMGEEPTFLCYQEAEDFVEDLQNIELFGRMSVLWRDDECNPDHQGLAGWELYCNEQDEWRED